MNVRDDFGHSNIPRGSLHPMLYPGKLMKYTSIQLVRPSGQNFARASLVRINLANNQFVNSFVPIFCMAFYCIKVFQKQGMARDQSAQKSTPTQSPQVPSYHNRQHEEGSPNPHSDLAGVGGNFGGSAPSTLLALDTLASALGGGALGLLSLLLALGGGLLLLSILDGLLASGLTGLGAHGAALLDHIEGGTDDGTLVLHNTAGTLLGNFLYVHNPVSNPSRNQIRMS